MSTTSATNMSISNNMTVGGTSTLSGALTSSSTGNYQGLTTTTLASTGNITQTGATSISSGSGGIASNGALTCTTLTTSSNASVNGNMTVTTGNTNLYSDVNIYNAPSATRTIEILDSSGNSKTNIYSSYISNKFVIDNNSTNNANGFSFAVNGSDVCTISNAGLLTPSSLAITGNITANGATITPTELSYLDGGTQNINTAVTALQSKCTDITYSASTTTIANNVAVNGNTTLGNSGSDTTTVNGDVTMNNNLTVIGTTNMNGNVNIGDGSTDSGVVTGSIYFNPSSVTFPSTTSSNTGLQLYRNASGGDGEVDLLANINAGSTGAFRFYVRSNSFVPTLIMDLKKTSCDFQNLNISTTGTFNSGAITSTGDVYANSGKINQVISGNGNSPNQTVSSTTLVNVMSVTLTTAGTWNVKGNLACSWTSNATTGVQYQCGLHTTNNSLPSYNTCIIPIQANTANSQSMECSDIFTVSANTVIYFNFVASTIGSNVTIYRPTAYMTAVRLY